MVRPHAGVAPATPRAALAELLTRNGTDPRVAGEVLDRLEAAGVVVVKALVGNYFTSLEMMGVTLSVLQLDEELEQFMKHPCDSIGFKQMGVKK